MPVTVYTIFFDFASGESRRPHHLMCSLKTANANGDFVLYAFGPAAHLSRFPMGLVRPSEPYSPVVSGDSEAEVTSAMAYMSPWMKPSGGLKTADSNGDFVLDAFRAVSYSFMLPDGLVSASEPQSPVESERQGGGGPPKGASHEPTDEAIRRPENGRF